MQACAHIVGNNAEARKGLAALAAQLGFERVTPFAGLAAAERGALGLPLSFFLFTEVAELGLLAGPARAIRLAEMGEFRFSPLIYFSRTPSLDTIRACIGMGFDDVIASPFTAERVTERLARQVDTLLAYYETPSYFGPDRRRGSAGNATAEERRGEGAFRRFEIRRDTDTGIAVSAVDRPPSA